MSSKSRGLGRGIDSLIADNFDKSLIADSNERIQKLFISEIEPLKNQPRKHFDEIALKELATSIKQYGVLQPIIVSESKEGKYTIIAGERRYRASKLAGLKDIPAIVRRQKDQEKLEIALVENVQRVDLSPTEQARTIYALHSEFNLSYESIAKRLGKAVSTVSNIVRLLQLPKKAFEALEAGKISEGHARAILAVKDETEQNKLLDKIIKEGLSVRQAENFGKRSKTSNSISTKKVVGKKYAEGADKLSQKLNTKVRIASGKKGGKLEIYYKDDSQLEKLLEIL